MIKHSFIHTNLRPHECNACDAKFKQPEHLKTHLRKIHGMVNWSRVKHENTFE